MTNNMVSNRPADQQLVREISEVFPWGHPQWAQSIPVRRGFLRNDRPLISADTDCEAVAMWLAEVAKNSERTLEAYKREAERLLLWAADSGMALSEVLRDDLSAYHDFLEDPPKNSPLIGKKVYKRTDIRWRPFTGALSENSIKASFTILRSLYSYLSSSAWLRANPFPDKKFKPAPEPDPGKRSLNKFEMRAIFSWLSVNSTSAKTDFQRLTAARTRWVVAILLHLGLRESECAMASMGDFEYVRQAKRNFWELAVTGKGGKRASIAASEQCMQEVQRFRVELGLSPMPSPGEEFPLVPDLRQFRKNSSEAASQAKYFKPVERTLIYKLVKDVFRRAADLLEAAGGPEEDAAERAHAAANLRRASPHWLRHTSITDLVAVEPDLTIAQKFARHTNINTTAHYAKKGNEEVADRLEKRPRYE
ncbi:site-specific integrase (plasmid) [Hydrocarboniclastica marina]|uniref:Site-specific integrase n=2 Tax=Hydrocarboniclastica marina TaxID=2259620 RepID=A0A4P7XLB1_9ALTE|nr:site-specific integrase [Hydrocarboniclastica marina]